MSETHGFPTGDPPWKPHKPARPGSAQATTAFIFVDESWMKGRITPGNPRTWKQVWAPLQATMVPWFEYF